MKWLGLHPHCSCGCGRPVRREDRRTEGRARTARDLVEKMEARGFAEDEDEYRRAFLFEGVSWRNQYVRVVHGELSLDQTRSDAAWATWKAGAQMAVRDARGAGDPG